MGRKADAMPDIGPEEYCENRVSRQRTPGRRQWRLPGAYRIQAQPWRTRWPASKKSAARCIFVTQWQRRTK
jgi:hypothetical protein